MENTQLTTAPKAVDLLKSMLNAPSVQEQFVNALGSHKDTFVASLIDLYTGDKMLQNCKPSAIVAEALRAATLHLPLNKALGFAYIVVYNNSEKKPDGTWHKVATPTFIPGYKGYIQLAMRTGQYKTINADVVYEGELRYGNKLSGEIILDGERKSNKVVGYFCYFELLNGFSKTLYVPLADMAEYAKKYSPSISKATTVEQLVEMANKGGAKKVGWEGNFNDMALKTVVRRLLSKYGYLSVEMQSALVKDIDSEVERNEQITEEANVEMFDDFDEVIDKEKAVVDSTTGEVLVAVENEPF